MGWKSEYSFPELVLRILKLPVLFVLGQLAWMLAVALCVGFVWFAWRVFEFFAGTRSI